LPHKLWDNFARWCNGLLHNRHRFANRLLEKCPSRAVTPTCDPVLVDRSATSPHVPVARLPDGSPAFAPPGRLAVVDGGRLVACHACGDLLTHVSPAHLRRHGLDGSTYRRRYGLPQRQSLAAPGLRSTRAVEGRRRYARNAGVRTGLEHGQRRTHRLAQQRLELVRGMGFASVEEYLHHRYDVEGWSVHAIGAELRTGRRVLPRFMDAAAVPRRPPGKRSESRLSTFAGER
jgi:hypothetical protein